MSESIGYNIKIETLFDSLGLGIVVENPKPVYGGLLHKSFEVLAEGGHYFVKALNPKIMQRQAVMDHYRFSDKVSVIASSSGIPASSVMKFNNQTIHCIDGQYYQVFEWLDGKDYVHKPENLDVCKSIGQILGEIHRTDFSDIYGENMENEKKTPVDWTGIIEDSRRDEMLRKLKEQVDFDYIESIEESSLLALNNLSELVISHRDLDPKNVMLGTDRIIVIDWEASGYVNPMHELIEVALYWSEYEDGTVLFDAFRAVISGYEAVTELNEGDMLLALEAVNYNKIGWIEYNLKRALGIESNSDEECQLGYEQVIDTIKSIQSYEEQKADLMSALAKL